MSFTLIQQKLTQEVNITICDSMDIIILLSEDSTITLYRTFTWEKIASKSNIMNSIPTSFSFSPSGKVIAIGSEDGTIVVLDLESLLQISSYSIPGATPSAINKLVWQKCNQQLPYNLNESIKTTWFYGGLNLAARAGMREYLTLDEADVDDRKDILSLSSLFSSTYDTLLFALQSDCQMITVYMFAIYPIYTIDLNLLSFPTQLHSDLKIGNSFGLCSSLTLQKSSHKGVDLHILQLPCFLSMYKWIEHKSRLLLQMNKDVIQMESLISECNKKWKEVARPIPAKMSLLKGTLDTYQLSYSTVQFLYSIALGGQWHPAAQTAFATGWNEQGLTRLRTSIESACKDIEKILFSSFYPLLTNFLLRCRELLGLIESEKDAMISIDTLNSNDNNNNNNNNDNDAMEQEQNEKEEEEEEEKLPDIYQKQKQDILSLIYQAEILFFKLDETYNESQVASEHFRLFLQFVKLQVAVAATESETTSDKPPFVDPNPKSTYLKLFDPRIPRAPVSQAEFVTGTHLYTQFMDSPLPEPLVNHRLSRNGFYFQNSYPYSQQQHEIINQILHLHKLSLPKQQDNLESELEQQSIEKISFITQLKNVKSSLQSIFHHYMNSQHINTNINPLGQDVFIQIIPSSTQEILASTFVSISSTSIFSKEESNNLFSIHLSGSTSNSESTSYTQSLDSQLIAYIVSDSNSTHSPYLHLVWRIHYSSTNIQYYGTSISLVNKFPSNLTSIKSLQFYIQNKPNSLTGINDINISLIGISSFNQQNLLFKIHVYSNKSNDDQEQQDEEDNEDNYFIRYHNISSLMTSITSTSSSISEAIFSTKLSSYSSSLNSNLNIKLRELPSFPNHLSVSKLLCSNGRGIASVLYQKKNELNEKLLEKNVFDGLVVYDIEEDEEGDDDEEEDDDDDEGEEGGDEENKNDSDNDEDEEQKNEI